ncbi:hypothetical protein EV44_g2106 [Erysiphe necator]|uniref:Uncharacterized protein n=1 Tax=Uncinula necator TaxID=52586 RepID=A0A0B1PAG5_UNCNE|nr:hypothetical protein EV44_g2106 [Erysiphe necator]
MSIMEGFLLVPPDRGSLIGRASWKPRYIVLGNHIEPNFQSSSISSLSDKSSKSRIHLKSSSKPDLTDISEKRDDRVQLYLSIYKAKGEWEYLAHHPMSAVQFCEIRNIQHRKQSPPLPTLVVEFKPESTTSKLKKRRSSKAGMTLKDGYSNALLFRSVDHERHSIYDWVVQMKILLTAPVALGDSAFSSLVSITNPFINRSNSSSTKKTESQGKYPEVISPSPSLRSRRSDLSSKASSLAHGSGLTSPLAYTSGITSEHPSPSSTSGYDHQLIEGWTSAQGRTSALSSHTRGNNSNASGITSYATRETILDRAFQMRCIPGSERLNSPEDLDKLSSTARFEALMRENDEIKHARSDARSTQKSGQTSVETKVDENGACFREDPYMGCQEEQLPIPAQKALDFISGRRATTRQPKLVLSKNEIPNLNTQALSALLGDDVPVDEQGSMISRIDTSSQRNSSRPSTLTIPLRSFSSTTVLNEEENNSNQPSGKLDSKEKRLSGTSVKRLSFQEFARRLSSTSSLLLVQTNASSNSGRGYADYTSEMSNNSRSCSNNDERDRRCSWRSGVSAFGVDGTFM